MNAISHHISEPLMVAYAAGNLAEPYSLVVATHISMCDECRARMTAHECAGGVLLEDAGERAVSDNLKDRVLSGLDIEVDTPPVYSRSGVFPGPVMAALKGKPPKWKSLGFGVRQQILQSSSKGSVRLLYIPGGQAVPDHSHDGLELTLVLQGAFSDESGRFGVGDLEIADDDVDHAPMAENGDVCICLAATSAPLRFNSWVPRLFQPLFRI